MESDSVPLLFPDSTPPLIPAFPCRGKVGGVLEIGAGVPSRQDRTEGREGQGRAELDWIGRTRMIREDKGGAKKMKI
eukprot:766239-Hanusia_phi.AAC.2